MSKERDKTCLFLSPISLQFSPVLTFMNTVALKAKGGI